MQPGELYEHNPLDPPRPILRPGPDLPYQRGLLFTDNDYRSWYACITGFVVADLIVFFFPDFAVWAWIFAAIGAVPLVLLPSRLAARRRVLFVQRRVARRDHDDALRRVARWTVQPREWLLAVVAAIPVVVFVLLHIALLRAGID